MSRVADKIRSSDLTWHSRQPMESEAVTPDGRRLRIKQSVGRLGSSDTFWYCYQWLVGGMGWLYIGTEPRMELAKSRALSGKMRVPAVELEQWLKDNEQIIPDDLFQAERARLELWKKDPESKRLTQPIAAGGNAMAAEETVGGKETKARKVATVNGRQQPKTKAGRPSQTAVIRIVKREFTGKPGTKWRSRQEAIFALDGSTVKDANDNDAVKHMLEDGTIRLEE